MKAVPVLIQSIVRRADHKIIRVFAKDGRWWEMTEDAALGFSDAPDFSELVDWQNWNGKFKDCQLTKWGFKEMPKEEMP